MRDLYEAREATGREDDARTGAPADREYARRIDCCDSPGSRERAGAGHGRGAPEPEGYAARARRTEMG